MAFPDVTLVKVIDANGAKLGSKMAFQRTEQRSRFAFPLRFEKAMTQYHAALA